jgi:hypothetical protein
MEGVQRDTVLEKSGLIGSSRKLTEILDQFKVKSIQPLSVNQTAQQAICQYQNSSRVS